MYMEGLIFKNAKPIASNVIVDKDASPRGTIRLAKATEGPFLPITPGKIIYNEAVNI